MSGRHQPPEGADSPPRIPRDLTYIGDIEPLPWHPDVRRGCDVDGQRATRAIRTVYLDREYTTALCEGCYQNVQRALSGRTAGLDTGHGFGYDVPDVERPPDAEQ